jgi:hypothetical protein
MAIYESVGKATTSPIMASTGDLVVQLVDTDELGLESELHPLLAAANRRQREALLEAVAAAATGWSPEDRVLAAATLDVLWGVVSYERIVIDWDLDPKEAIRGITWVIGLVEAAVREGRGPGS